ncbi:MAG: mannitol dehydrogenase family protein [Deltaproteobacteria bacterium]|nr:MAG: mannitol dehydrogenase family protein [Deltaproteobacteria bacterium]
MANAIQLNRANLKSIAGRAQVPSFDPAGLPGSIVHVGVGGFHRAHQAVYLDDLLAQGGARQWGLCGVGLLPHDARMRDVLRAQDCLYTVIERSGAGDRARVIGSIGSFLFAPDEPEAVIEKMASPVCRIVSLTITEGGYYVNEGTGQFDATHPDIRHDLEHPHAPKGAFGYLAEALDRRRQRGLAPFTVMSCDNLQGNGDIARRMFLAFAERRNEELARWIAENGAFPNGMVDRITPATTDAHRDLVRESFGIIDGWPVVTEPFKQWVIEDRFPAGRPPWERVGAQMVSDVHPYEMMKIRLLNASHAQYRRTLIERFGNPVLRDQLARIGTEGSARIPKFVLPSILDRVSRGGPMRALTFTVAAWFRYLAGTDERGNPLPINDPMSEELVRRARAGGEDPKELLGIVKLFGTVLPNSPAFTNYLAEALKSLHREGARQALKKCLQS